MFQKQYYAVGSCRFNNQISLNPIHPFFGPFQTSGANDERKDPRDRDVGREGHVQGRGAELPHRQVSGRQEGAQVPAAVPPGGAERAAEVRSHGSQGHVC